MNETEYVVFWISHGGSSHHQKHLELTVALAHAESLRKQGFRFVTMCAENADQVGKMGVDSVEDGKTPDGIDYTWVKRREV